MWYEIGKHQVGLTEGFEHSCLLSLGRFCPINNISELCKHLSLKQQIQSYFVTRVLQRKPITHTYVIVLRKLESTMTDWPQRGWRLQTQSLLPPCCQRTPPPPSSARRPAPSSQACTLPPLLSNTRETLYETLIGTNVKISPISSLILFVCVNYFFSPATCAPGLTHWPKSTGSVHLVTVTMASAPLTASSTETYGVTGPLTVRQNLSAPCFVWLHTRTCEEGNNKNSFPQ